MTSISVAELKALKEQLKELGEKNQRLEEYNIDAASKLELEYKKYQTIFSDNRQLKESLKQGDMCIQEREAAIVERDRYIDQLEIKLKQLHSELMQKDMMLKST